MTILQAIREILKDGRSRSLQEIYTELPDTLEHSIRARICENLGRHFKRVGEGVYIATHEGAACVVISGCAWEEIQKIPSCSIDALITDPPYTWVNKHFRGVTRKRSFGFETRDVDVTLALELNRVLKDGAHAFFFVPAESEVTRSGINKFLDMLTDCGFQFNKRMIWNKVFFGMGYHGRAQHEGILFMSKGKRRKPFDLAMPDLLSVTQVHHRKRIHEAEKPVHLLERLVRFSTKAREVILDCFAGSCSTGVAALKHGRSALLIERAL